VIVRGAEAEVLVLAVEIPVIVSIRAADRQDVVPLWVAYARRGVVLVGVGVDVDGAHVSVPRIGIVGEVRAENDLLADLGGIEDAVRVLVGHVQVHVGDRVGEPHVLLGPVDRVAEAGSVLAGDDLDTANTALEVAPAGDVDRAEVVVDDEVVVAVGVDVAGAVGRVAQAVALPLDGLVTAAVDQHLVDFAEDRPAARHDP